MLQKLYPVQDSVSLTMYLQPQNHLQHRAKAPCSRRGHGSARKGQSQQSESETELSVADPFEAQML